MSKETLFVAISNQKGGVGKSALSVVLASYFHFEKGLNVAIVDCDSPQHSLVRMRERDKKAVSNSAYLLSIRDAGTEMPALIVGTIPIWVMLLGKPHGLRWAAMLPGLALTAAGLVLMSNAALSGAEQAPAASESIATSSTYWRGIALSVLAMVCWTVFTLLNARWLRQHPEVGSTDWANWLGVATGLGGLLLALTLGTPLPQLMASPGWPLFALIAIAIGFGSSWLATILWNQASRRLPASLCGQLIVSETLFALLYSFLWDGRWPTLAQWAAAALFTAGILASIRAHR